MKVLSKKLTEYVIESGIVSEKLYAIYQYGFQIGLEMLSCFLTCLIIAVYLHMVLKFLIFTVIFMLLRMYAGGVHLNSFVSCYLCSVTVQIGALLLDKCYSFSLAVGWGIVFLCSMLIFCASPVDSEARELDRSEKRHCKAVTLKVIICIFIFLLFCTFLECVWVISLTAWTLLTVAVSQFIGIIKNIVNTKHK